MDPARIAELLQPFLAAKGNNKPAHTCQSEEREEEPAILSLAQLQSISTYINILLRWNARINLTGIRDPEDIVTRHFGESLFAARQLFPGGAAGQRAGGTEGARKDGRAARQGRVTGHEAIGPSAPEAIAQEPRPETEDRPIVADLGSGAGFPGIPIKLWAPHISLTLIESNHKKSAFLREIIRALTLTDVNIQNTRAESLSSTFDVVTLRAVERFGAILPTAAALVAPTGRLALLISSAQEPQARASLPDLLWCPRASVPLSRSRILAVGHRQQ
jgi:16S rRNA (guanine527-N7)-methyltransferase